MSYQKTQIPLSDQLFMAMAAEIKETYPPFQSFRGPFYLLHNHVFYRLTDSLWSMVTTDVTLQLSHSIQYLDEIILWAFSDGCCIGQTHHFIYPDEQTQTSEHTYTTDHPIAIPEKQTSKENPNPVEELVATSQVETPVPNLPISQQDVSHDDLDNGYGEDYDDDDDDDFDDDFDDDYDDDYDDYEDYDEDDDFDDDDDEYD